MNRWLVSITAAAAAAGAFAVESQNIVGYQEFNIAGNNGITWQMATFKGVGSNLNAQPLSAFQFPTDQGFGSGDTIWLQVFGSDGSLVVFNEGEANEVVGEFSFVDAANASTYGLTKTGWYPLTKIQEWLATDEDCANDLTIPFGSGVIITSGEADTTMRIAGEVVTNLQFTIPGYNGISWTGNATPVDMYLKDFAIPTDAGFGSGDTIWLQIFGTDGSLETINAGEANEFPAEFSFVDAANASTYGLTKTGWYPLTKIQEWLATDEDWSGDVLVPAGKMVIITSGEADTTLSLPNPVTYSASNN